MKSTQCVRLVEYDSNWVAGQHIYHVGLEVRTQLFGSHSQGQSDSFEICVEGFDVDQHPTNKLNWVLPFLFAYFDQCCAQSHN